jgi:hypothetical protein
MKKKSTQSAFFNVRVLLGLFIVLAGTFVALASFGVFSVTAANLDKALRKNQIITYSNDPLVPLGFDCSKIHQLGIDKQENFRAGAIMVACGEQPGGSPNTAAGNVFSRLVQKVLGHFTPLNYGGADVDLITGTETSPNITQSETYSMSNPDDPSQVVVAYNDSRGRNASPINISGVSVSTDGGTTFNRLTLGSGQGPFSNTEGDPVLLYHRPTSTWLTVWIGDGQCGGGLGGYKTTTPANAASWTHYPCVNSSGGANDDRESGWSDVNPASSHYGTLYVSWNNFGLSGPPISVTHSTDGGNTWSAGVNLPIPSGASFIRDVQITGDYANGDVYVAGMDENNGGGCSSGCGTPRRNVIYRSTDGGATFAQTYVSPSTFVGPCRSNSGYFCCMYNSPAYWRHMGWGEPAVLNGVVSLVYAEKDGSDAGNVYYIRSTDNGVTFSAPMQLNSNTDATKAQWQPNISVSNSGTLLATWYDETPRVAASCQPSTPSTPCYQMYSRKSNDNGVTWQPDMPLSDVASPLPLQPDPGIVGVYVGDYDYGSASAAKHVTSWADGRVAIGGSSQQDAFTDRELVGFAVTSTTPACNSVVTSGPTDFIVNLSDAVNTGTVQPTDFTVNGIPANSDTISADQKSITFHFNSTPVTTQGTQTMNIPANAFTRVSDGMGVFAFNCTFCFASAPLQVVSTVPAVNGTFTPPAPGNYSFAVNFNQPIDSGSVSTSDLTLTGNVGGSVTAVMVSGSTATFTLHFNFGGSVTASIAAGSITANGCNANAAFTGNYTVLGCPPADHYNISAISQNIVPGTTDTGNHVDDGTTPVTLPFSYGLYDQTFTTVNVDSNGTLQFVSPVSIFTNSCLPDTTRTYIIFPYWDDLRTDVGLSGCTTWANGCGIFTSISGTAPNRIFNIEWHAVYFANNAQTANFEVRLYEGQSRFDVVYGVTSIGNSSSTAGVQKTTTAFDQYFCNGSGQPATGAQSYIITPCQQVTVLSAVSRVTHAGGCGTFDVPLSLTAPAGVEDRSTGGNYTVVVTFSGNETVTSAAVSCHNPATGTGTTGAVGGSGTPVITIPLTGVSNAQTLNLHIVGTTNADIPMSILIGDTNGNGTVNAADIAQTKGRLGAAVDGTNFRSDVNANCAINAGDVALIKQNSGSSVPGSCP